VGGCVVGWLVTRVICGKTVRDTVLHPMCSTLDDLERLKVKVTILWFKISSKTVTDRPTRLDARGTFLESSYEPSIG